MPDDTTPNARELARVALTLTRHHDSSMADALRPIREHLGVGPDAEARLIGALQNAAEAPDQDAAWAVFEAAAMPPPILRPAADFADATLPAPVLWRDPGPSLDADGSPDAVLSVGEVALLSAEGGLGKSYVTLALAATAANSKRCYGTACGLRVMAGPVAVVSFEDSAVRVAHRLRDLVGTVPAAVHVAEDPAPLWTAEGDRGGASGPAADYWPRLWAAIRAVGARLVVIDPASAALADVSTSETGPVRAFLRALAAEAAPRGDWPGCGVLIVAHSTKAARNAMAAGEAPDAGVVAGSAAWYDGARGVLTMWRESWLGPDGESRLIMECVKANYGRTGWGARLQEDIRNGRFCGLKFADRMDRQAVEQARPKAKSKGGKPTTDDTAKVDPAEHAALDAL